MKKIALFLFAVVLAWSSRGTAAYSQLAWDKWRALLGTWEAEGKGAPGSGAGRFSFALDLQDKIIVRKSHTEYPASEGHGPFSHDDLMIVYRDESDQTRADYFDNEGHVIRYRAEVSKTAGRSLL